MTIEILVKEFIQGSTAILDDENPFVVTRLALAICLDISYGFEINVVNDKSIQTLI